MSGKTARMSANDEEQKIIFEPHTLKQEEVALSDSKITLAATGIQWGKTSVGAIWMKRKMHEFIDPDDNFIITSPDYKILSQSTLKPFLKHMDGYGEYHKVDAAFKMYRGGTCYLRTATHPDSIVGITNVRAIWGDEAGKYPLYFWENIQGRASFKDAPILLTTSPYSVNWVFKELIKPHKLGVRFDVKLIQAASGENPYFSKEELIRRERTMDPRRYKMMYGGEWDRMAGLVYDSWDDEENQCLPMKLPTDTRYVAGIDWGYTEPFVLVVRAITPSGDHFQVSEFYKTGFTIRDMVEIARKRRQVYGITKFYAGPDQPGYIEEFNRSGLTTVGADNDIMRGVGLHYQLIKQRKYKIFKGTSPHTMDELETYHYPDADDIGPDDDKKELKPVGQNDHALDANRYVSIMEFKDRRESHEPKLKPRLNTKGKNRQTETWG